MHGPPAAGKTSFMQGLRERLRAPLISKDEIKEALFDALGCETSNMSRRFGAVSFKLLFMQLEELLKTDVSCVVETAFMPEHDNARFARLQESYGCRFVQLYVTADGEVLYTRFSDRAVNGERHRGHCDSGTGLRLRALHEAGRWAPLEIDGRTITVDTTDWGANEFDGDAAANVIETVCIAVASERIESRLAGG